MRRRTITGLPKLFGSSPGRVLVVRCVSHMTAIAVLVVFSAAVASTSSSLCFAQAADSPLTQETVGRGLRAGVARSRAVQLISIPSTVVAVVDTGVNVTHSLLSGRIAPGGYNVVSGSTDVTDVANHGTLVASIITSVSDPLGGVLGAKVLPIRVFDSSTTNDANASAGIRYSLGRASIVNISYSSATPVSESALRDAVAGGQLVIVAAGNRGGANPDWPARYAREEWTNRQIIAVGAVDGQNVIASFSNRAGDTSHSFLVAPGVNVSGASSASSVASTSSSGTSLAAPYVSGVAALVKAYWPQLTAKQIATILLNTATDLGTPGPDEIYGRGLVNADAALSPLGVVKVLTASGRAIPIREVAVAPGPVTGAALRIAAQQGQLRGVGVDDYGRQFYYDFGAGVQRARSLSVDQIFGQADRQLSGAEQSFANGARVLYVLDTFAHGAGRHPSLMPSERVLAGSALTLPLSGGAEIAAGTLGTAPTYFGFGAAEVAPLSALPTSFSNPLFSFTSGYSHFALGSPQLAGLKIKAGVLTNLGKDPLLSQYGVSNPSSRANLALVEVSRRIGPGWFALSASQLEEPGALLGSSSGEAFAIAARPTTRALSLQAAWPLTAQTTVIAQYTQAQTEAVNNASVSLVSEVSRLGSNAYSVGLLSRDTWRTGDRFTLSLAQPLRIFSGAIGFDLPVDVSAQGNLIRAQQTVNLRPSGHERLVEMQYSIPLTRQLSAGAVAIYRHQPNHDAAAPAERVLGLRFVVRL
jgi:Subtilase family